MEAQPSADATVAKPAPLKPSSFDLTGLERKVQNIAAAELAPLADQFGFRLGLPTTDATGMPTVLMIGNFSSGKSSFINYLFGKEIQKTSVAPMDDGFTLIRHSDKESDLDGKTIVTHPDLPYSDLQQFGPTFLSNLKFKFRNSELLRNLVLIDSPGMIDPANEDRTRGYDFLGAVKHFSEMADLIVFFFDPDRPGVVRESMDALGKLGGSGVAHKLLIVMNKVDMFKNIRDFARAYGALCWNLAHVIRTKDLPHIFCTYIESASHVDVTAANLPLADFKKSCDEVVAEIHRAPERRADNLVSSLHDTARRLQAHVRVATAVATQNWRASALTWAITALVLIITALLDWRMHDQWQKITAIGVVIALVVFGLGKLVLHQLHATALATLDQTFWKTYERDRLQQKDTSDLEALWASVKPGLLVYLKKVPAHKIPTKFFVKSKLNRLDKIVETDVPDLYKDIPGVS